METLIHPQCPTKLQFTISSQTIVSSWHFSQLTGAYVCVCAHECSWQLTSRITGLAIWHTKGEQVSDFKKTCGSEYVFQKTNQNSLKNMKWMMLEVDCKKIIRHVCFTSDLVFSAEAATAREPAQKIWQLFYAWCNLDSKQQPQNYKTMTLITNYCSPKVVRHKFIKLPFQGLFLYALTAFHVFFLSFFFIQSLYIYFLKKIYVCFLTKPHKTARIRTVFLHNSSLGKH